VREALRRFDLLLAPTAPSTAPLISSTRAPLQSGAEAAGRFFTRRSYSTPASLAGLPALSVPCGFTESGLPIGLQLIGRRFEDATLLRAAYTYERATSWRERRPPVESAASVRSNA
jgi:Asp-tRNA(Asn)/Glu-tRNA(Gln) amidotransferase A subunit family amidase